MEHLFLIVGLGNPGREYARTRHNAGFLALDRLADRWKAAWRDEGRFQSRLARVEHDGRRVILCQPQTFMNASGEAVGAVARFYQADPQRLLVVVDDADLPLGALRLRGSGSSGGHHGLESIEQHLGTRGYARLRLGIGRQDPVRREITGHVLGRFHAAEAGLLEKVLTRASEQIECWMLDGLTQAMNRFNGVLVDAHDTQQERNSK